VTETNVFKLAQPDSFVDPLTAVLRNGARTLLAQAVEAEVAEFLAELGEDVLQAPLERPLLVVPLGLGHGRQIDGRRSGAPVPALSKTRSSTSTGTFARIASAMASDGRASSWSSGPPVLR